MRKALITLLVMVGYVTGLNAQTVRHATHLAPNGKGWGIERKVSERKVSIGAGTAANRPASTNGIIYHGGPVMRANPVNVYFIWYGDWTNGPKLSDRQNTVNLLDILFAPTRGIGSSGFFKINTTYSDTVGHPTGNIALVASTTNNYSRGKKLADSDVQSIVSGAISSRTLPND